MNMNSKATPLNAVYRPLPKANQQKVVLPARTSVNGKDLSSLGQGNLLKVSNNTLRLRKAS